MYPIDSFASANDLYTDAVQLQGCELHHHDASHRLIEQDHLLRWSVECLVALGMQFEHALIVSQGVCRSCAHRGDAAPVDALLNEMDQIRSGSLSVEPGHEAGSRSNNSLAVCKGHGISLLALHDSVEFLRHAAVAHGWAAVELDTCAYGEAALVYLDAAAREGFGGLAVLTNGSGWEAVRIVAALPQGEHGSEVFQVPMLLLLAAGPVVQVQEPPGIGMFAADFLGGSVALEDWFFRVRPGGVQLLVATPDRFAGPMSEFRSRLLANGVVPRRGLDPGASGGRAAPAIPVEPLVLQRMCSWSRDLSVFAPG